MDVTAIIIAASIPSAINLAFASGLLRGTSRNRTKRGRPRKKLGARTWRGAKTYGSNKSFTSSKA
mgnify:CR=1 FL=1